MKDKRDEVIEAAKKILGERMPTRDLPNATFSFEYLSGAMADFALSREAELRRQIADELGELRSNVVDVEFLQGRLDIFEEQIRGKQ